MKQTLLIAILALAVAAGATAAAAPTLTLSGSAGVLGRHFKPHTLVRVAFGAQTPKRLVRTTAAGTFTAALPPTYDRCTGLTVVATAAGRTTTLVLPVPRGCLPASADGPPDINGG